MMVSVKEFAYQLCNGPYQYDHREVFQLSDGGQIHIDFKGDFFNPNIDMGGKRERNLIVLVNSLVGHSQDLKFVPAINQLFKGIDDIEGFDVIVINYRGLAGAALTTPRIYGCASTDDIREPLLSIHSRFCKG